MTDRVKGFTVTLEHDIRIDDVQPILEAIRMIRGVVDVQPSIANSDDMIIESRVRSEFREKFYKFLKDNL